MRVVVTVLLAWLFLRWSMKCEDMKKRAFVSFDYNEDKDKKGALTAQAEDPESPFTISDESLQEAQPDHLRISRAQSAIAKCDVFIVILGLNTHQAPGVLKEVNIAKGLRKRRFQLKAQGTDPTSVSGGGPIVNWTWPKLKRMLSD